MRLLASSGAFLVVAAAASSVVAHQAKRSYSTHDYYVLEHDPSSSSTPHHEVIDELGAELVEQVGELQNHWLIRRPKDIQRDDDLVMKKYHSLRRKATSRAHTAKGDVLHARHIVSSVRSLERQVLRQRTKRWLYDADALAAEPRQESQTEEESRFDAVVKALELNDPEFHTQWHLLNIKTPPHDMNVSGVWEMGYTGKGIISAIVDDGLDYNSEDLAANYWARGSWDFNNPGPSPLPKLSDDMHGTRCAGEVAAARNDVCGVGVAYDSKISGVRILSGAISDADEAASLNYGYNETSIYSCSWGPPDDGRSMEAPSPLIQKAVLNGIENGRGGKGSIFVFASGNGASNGDQCNFDGYTNSIYSVTVSAVDWKGQHPYYSETCAANMVVAYSSGGGGGIHTTDIGKDKCTGSHGGTSAAAPLAVGVFALALEARPELSWRDIQHLCVHTAKQINPQDPDWDKTVQGRYYSYKYGFGALDAYAFVTAAKTWSLVKPQAWIEMSQVEFANATMTWEGDMSGGTFIPKDGLNSTMEITQDLLTENNFETLEHITVKVWIDHSRRGDVEVYLLSPNGVKSMLGGKRRNDDDKNGYPGWTFMTLKHWDENPIGTWLIHVSDQANDQHNGTFLGWTMSFWGSTIDPSKAIYYSQRPQPEEDLPDPIFETEPTSTDSLASIPVSTITTTSTTSASSTTITPSTTKSYVKPTEHLPEDHEDAEGESHKPAFDDAAGSETAVTSTVTNPSVTPSMTVVPDEGIFAGMSDLLSNSTWLYGGLGMIVLLGIGAGIFFWRRRVQRTRGSGDYTTVGDDEMAMQSMLHGGKATDASGRRRGGAGVAGTKELYDAFGEVSDEDEDYADEEMALHGSGRPPVAGVRYHDGFLDDDAAESPVTRYRDEPATEELKVPEHSSPGSSGTSSWEQAQTSSSEAVDRVPPA